jgi:large subunit ribosomal protein L25
MSDDIALDLQERTVTGKAVKHLRREGLVPAVIHDHGKPSVHVSGNYAEVMKAYKEVGKHHPLQLKVGNKAYTALIKIAEFEPRKHQLAHVVFGAVNTNEKVTAEIPIRLTDDIPAEKVSLIVIHQLDTVEVEALARDLPDELVVDASSLVEIGDKLTVADVKAPAGVVILTEPEHAIATVFEPSALAAANDAAGGDAELETEESVEGEAENGETEAAGSEEDNSKSEDQSN